MKKMIVTGLSLLMLGVASIPVYATDDPGPIRPGKIQILNTDDPGPIRPCTDDPGPIRPK